MHLFRVNRNASRDELLTRAEIEENELAVALHDMAYEDGKREESDRRDFEEAPENNDFPIPSSSERHDIVKYLYGRDVNDIWVKVDDGIYTIAAFETTTNIYNNNVEITRRGSSYDLKIEYGAYGETVLEIKSVGKLREAKDRAIEEAARLCIEGLLNC